MILTFISSLLLLSSVINGLTLASSNVERNGLSASNALTIAHRTAGSFLTRLHRASSTHLRSRQPVTSRPIDSCRSSTAEFVHSHCVHNSGMIGSMQSYIVLCRDSNSEGGTRTQNGRGPRQPTTTTSTVPRLAQPTAEWGRCSQDEICMNGELPGGWGSSMASCVRKDRFMTMAERADDGWRRALLKGRELIRKGGLINNAVLSDDEGRTPIKVQEIELAFEKEGTGVSANSSSLSGSVKTQICTDCFEVIAPEFATNASLLTADVKVAGTAAATGILWLAFLSG